MDYSGLNCLVTGANTGLGFALSRRLARSDAHIIMLCRDKERGRDAVSAIRKESPNASVDLMLCDLASMESTQNFIGDFKAKYSRLDILFNNAAVMKRKRTLTEDGFEMMFQVNYLAPFILMNSFLEQLKRSSSHQIINCARPADDLRLDFSNLQFENKYHMWKSFFQTKLPLLIASLELARRHGSDEVTVTLAVPGTFKSELVRDFPGLGWVKNLFSMSVDTAAENMLRVVALVDADRQSGRVFEKGTELPLTSYWKDTEVSERLWSTAESLIANSPYYRSHVGHRDPIRTLWEPA